MYTIADSDVDNDNDTDSYIDKSTNADVDTDNGYDFDVVRVLSWRLSWSRSPTTSLMVGQPRTAVVTASYQVQAVTSLRRPVMEMLRLHDSTEHGTCLLRRSVSA